MNMKIYILMFSAIFYDAILANLQAFNRFEFDKYIDQDYFVVTLICSSSASQNCRKERQKLDSLSKEMSDHIDIIFAYTDKESDAIMAARCDVPSFPMVKLFPYHLPSQNYVYNIRISDLKAKILEIKDAYMEYDDSSDLPENNVRESKRIPINDIDWLDMASLVKDPEKHVILILYDDDCIDVCRIMERVAKIFDHHPEVAFYKMNLDNTGVIIKSLTFHKDPTIFWYPKNDKEGMVYQGKETLEAFLEYINENAGLYRNADGDLKPNAGRIKEIDEIIHENIFSILTNHKIDYYMFQIEQITKKLPHQKKFVNYYLAILQEMKKETNPDHIILREQNFLNKKISQNDPDNIETEIWTQYLNILSAFVDFASDGVPEHKTTNGAPNVNKASARSKVDNDIKYRATLKTSGKWSGILNHQMRHEEL